MKKYYHLTQFFSWLFLVWFPVYLLQRLFDDIASGLGKLLEKIDAVGEGIGKNFTDMPDEEIKRQLDRMFEIGIQIGRRRSQGEMDQYAIENVETERTRIFTILARVFPEHEEEFRKVILNNKK